MCNCNCANNIHRVLTVLNSGTAIQLTATESTNIGNMERYNLIVCKPISSLVMEEPLPVEIQVNGVYVPVKNSFGLPLLSDVVPWGLTCGRYVEGETENYVILKTPYYA